ncbi:hypothetical protein KJ657_05435 [Patescibacteria group bacterium]|nr:hypothetical protein [Patescibacteria group bacterium]MBU1016500.1 hypothetical protein [Patescibacteria group bacterium]MBU1685121.1 hypothetical protein [Patescibacteria group bacterium]MBU1938621.1 hypothetical protein [Patescibacteria group bacterium]
MNLKSVKILIAAAIVVISANLLAGCSPKNVSEAGMERIAEAQEMKKTVKLSLVQVKADDKGFVLRLMLDNPEKKPITSLQAWLAYNPDDLKGISIDTAVSAFELTAPYDNNFDNEAGLMMLGRSAVSAVNDKEIVVADLHFGRVSDGVAMIEAYDYKQDLTGHTSANMMLDGAPVNILLKPQSPLLILNQ